MASLRFELLGEVRVFRDRLEVDLGPAKQRAVLAILLLNAGRPVPISRIVDAVWGHDPPENGSNVVQKYVAGLRRVLDPDRPPRTPGELIARTGAGYQITAGPDAMDVGQFRADVARAGWERDAGRPAEAAGLLSRALELWRGPALAGLTGAAFASARDALDEEHGTAWETWAEIELDRGEQAAVVPVLVRLVAEFPLREGLRALLMLALYRTGRQAEALTAFQDARRYLLEEFGVEPGSRLQEAHRTVLRDEPTPIPPAPAATPPQAWAPPAPRSPEPPPVAAPSAPPPYPPMRKGRRYSLVEVALAGLTPIVLCMFGSWIYFTVAAIRRRSFRLLLVAIGYVCLSVVFLIVIGESIEGTTQEDVGGIGLLTLSGLSSVHGMLVAAHPGNLPTAESRRAHARWLVASNPAQARELGIGRPDLPHEFDDGGLIDVNHVPGYELSRLRGLDAETAHQIVLDRYHTGPFQRVEDLLVRGLLTPAQMQRLGSRLICVPVDHRPAVDHPPAPLG